MAALRATPARSRLLAEGGWVSAGVLASGLGTLVGMRLLTELVPPGTFGTVSLILGAVAFSSNVLCTPQLHAAARFYPEAVKCDDDLPRFRATLARGLRPAVALAAALVLAGGVAWSAWTGRLGWPIFVLAAALLAAEVGRLYEMSLLNAARRQRRYASWDAAESWARPLAAALAVVALGAESESILLGYLGATASLLWLFRRLDGRRDAGRRLDGPRVVGPAVVDQELAREVRAYMLPLVPLALLSWIHSVGERYLLGGLVDVGAVGVYVAAYALVQRPLSLAPRILLTTLRPAYFEAVSASCRSRERETLRLWLGAAASVLALAVAAIYLLKDLLVTLLLAESYRGAAALLPVLAIGLSCQFLSQIFNTVSLAHKRSREVLYTEIGAAVAALGGGVVLILRFGLMGAALATCLAYLTHLTLAAGFAWRHLKAGDPDAA